MAILPINTSTFSQFTQGDNNVSGTATAYQTFLKSGMTVPPNGVKQIGPFSFDYTGDSNIKQTSEITDHFVESNFAVQDHIAIRPVSITLKGIVSELAFSSTLSNSLAVALTTVENQLSRADAYLGTYSPGATQKLLNAITQAQNIAVQIEQAAARTAQIASFFFPSPLGTKQQKAYAMLSALQLARVVFTVYTPFQVFTNMVIEDFDITQPAWTKTQATVTVRMKQLLFTNRLSRSNFLEQYGGRATAGYQPTVQNGITGGVESAVSRITSVF